MYTEKFCKDYVYYLKLHEESRTSTEERNKFWKQYMQEKRYIDNSLF